MLQDLTWGAYVWGGGAQGPDGLRYGHLAPNACLCLSPGVLTVLTAAPPPPRPVLAVTQVTRPFRRESHPG